MELPVTLIQCLHDRQQTLQALLDETRATLTQLSEHATTLTTELADIERLLSSYALPTADAPPVPAPVADEPDPVRPNAARSLLPTVADCIETILREQGPSTAVFVQRHLREDYGVEMASSTVHDALARGAKKGRYVKNKYTWRLAGIAQETTEAR